MKTLQSTLLLALSATFAGCAAPDTADPDAETFDAAEGMEDEGDLGEARAAVTGPEMPFTLRNGSNNHCMDVVDGSTADGAGTQAWYCNGGLNQTFIPVLADGTSRQPVPGDEIQLVARHTDKCLDVYGGFTTPDTRIIQWPCHGQDNQRWIVEDAGNDAVRLRSKSSNHCLSPETAMVGSPLFQHVCDTADAKQRWTFQATNAPPRPPAGTSVTLYEHTDYQGGGATFTTDVPNLDIWTWFNWDNLTSSVKVSQGGFVTLYRDPNYGGPCETVWFDTPSMFERLVGNDAVSSLRIGSYCPTVVLYEHASYGGAARSRSETDNLADIGFDNKVSSLRVSPGMRISTYSDPYYSGNCSSFTGDVSSLSSTLVGNDSLSSFRYGAHCNTRHVTFKNQAGMVARFRLKRSGQWTEFSGNVNAGESRTMDFTQNAPLEVEVTFMDGGGWVSACQETLDSSSGRTVKLQGVTFSYGCAVE